MFGLAHGHKFGHSDAVWHRVGSTQIPWKIAEFFGRVLLFVPMLLPTLVWSLDLVPRIETSAVQAYAPPPGQLPGGEEPIDLNDRASLVEQELASEPGSSVQVPARPARAADLLRARLYAIIEEESGSIKLEETDFGTRVRRGQVTLVLVWSTRCKECRRLWELPEVMEDAGVRHLEHVAVRVDSLDHPLNAWYSLQQKKVSIARSNVLVDIDTNPSRSAFMRATQESTGLGKAVEPPVVLVFDCRRALRLYRSGSLDAAGLDDLAQRVSALSEEVETRYCRGLPLKRQPSEKSIPLLPVLKSPRCGDVRCELGEQPEWCCDCLECKEGQVCVGGEQRGQRTRCVEDLAPRGPFR